MDSENSTWIKLTRNGNAKPVHVNTRNIAYFSELGAGGTKIIFASAEGDKALELVVKEKPDDVQRLIGDATYWHPAARKGQD